MRQVTHALLTRPPLSFKISIRRLLSKNSVRLACVRHAASVHPEPGSNSHVKSLTPASLNVSGITVFGLKIRIFTFLNFLKSFRLRSIHYCSLKNFQGCIVVYLSKNICCCLSDSFVIISQLFCFVNNFFKIFFFFCFLFLRGWSFIVSQPPISCQQKIAILRKKRNLNCLRFFLYW